MKLIFVFIQLFNWDTANHQTVIGHVCVSQVARPNTKPFHSLSPPPQYGIDCWFPSVPMSNITADLQQNVLKINSSVMLSLSFRLPNHQVKWLCSCICQLKSPPRGGNGLHQKSAVFVSVNRQRSCAKVLGKMCPSQMPKRCDTPTHFLPHAKQLFFTFSAICKVFKPAWLRVSHDVRVHLPVGFSSNLFFTEFFFLFWRWNEKVICFSKRWLCWRVWAHLLVEFNFDVSVFCIAVLHNGSRWKNITNTGDNMK